MLQTIARSLHRAHVVEGDDVDVAGGGDENVGARRGVLHRHDLIALHRRLQRADRIDFGDHHAAAGVAQRRRRALADVAEAGDHRDLAGHHHVGAAADAVDQRLAAAVEIVELRLGDAVVDVDRRPQQLAFLGHHIEAMDAGRRLLGDAADRGGVASRTSRACAFSRRLDRGEQHFLFLVARLVEERRVALFGAQAEMDQQRSRRRRRRGSCWARRRRPIRRCGGCSPNSPSRLSPLMAKTGVPAAAIAAAAWSWVE